MHKKVKPCLIAILSLGSFAVFSCVSTTPLMKYPITQFDLVYAFRSEGPVSPYFRFALGRTYGQWINVMPTGIDACVFLACWVDWPFLKEELNLDGNEKPSLELNRALYDADGNRLDEEIISSFGDPSRFPDSEHFHEDTSFCSLIVDMLVFEEIGYVPTYIEYGVVLTIGEKEMKPSNLMPGTVMDTRYFRVDEDYHSRVVLTFVNGVGGEILEGWSYDIRYEVPSLWLPFISKE